MNDTDHASIISIAWLAAMADGQAGKEEQAQLRAALGRLGVGDAEATAQAANAGQTGLADLARRLSSDDARRLAYETALVVCHADGPINDKETSFLKELRGVLGLSPSASGEVEQRAAKLSGAPLASDVEVGSGTPPSDASLDQLILQQAMLAGAVELLPDRLANVVIIPLQLRLVYQIGRRYGQQLDASQIKDLAGTLGLGAAAQVMEGAVRKLVRGVAGGLLGGLVGGATGLAAGAAVTFASTYALGHVAQQYYAQGRRLSTADLRALFQRFQDEAKALFPKLQDEIRTQASSLDLRSVLGGMRSAAS